MTMTSNMTNTSSSSKNKTEVDYGSIPPSDPLMKKATILDELDPLVQERMKAQKNKKRGVAALVAVLLVVAATAVVTNKEGSAKSTQGDPKAILDHRFASLLVDDQAFFFPSSATFGNTHGRRSLVSEGSVPATSSANPWALAWADNKDSFAAVGAYYHAKGKASAHYYKSLYDVSWFVVMSFTCYLL